MASADIFVATKTAVIHFEGRRTTIRKGVTRVRAGHPILTGHEGMFEPLEVQFDVEDATARPAEKRTRKPRTATPKAKADERPESGKP